MPESTSVQALQSKANQLNSSTDNLNQVLLAAEEALKDLRLGVTAAVPLWEDARETDQERSRYLRFGKWNNGWQLFIFTGLPGDGETGLVHVTCASRRERIQAATRMEALLFALDDEVAFSTTEVQKATDSLTRFIDGIK
jgi:hypothetical protein